MKKKILVPTDFSKHAWKALNYAMELFKGDDCDFYLLHTFRESKYVLQSMMVPEPGEHLYEMAKQDANEGLENVFQQIAATKGLRTNHQFKLVSKFKYLVEAIKYLEAELQFDFIIMGTKGITNAAYTIYGSNTVDVMEKIRSCLVIAVPASAEIKLPREIVFPTDYEELYKKKELDALIHIANKTNSSIKVLHVVDNEEKLKSTQKDHKELLKEYLKEVDHAFHVLNTKDTHMGINCFVESRGSDMVAFVNRKHSFFGSILSRPLIKSLGYYSKVPVLALHN